MNLKMNYKNFLFFLFFIINSCADYQAPNKNKIISHESIFSSQGFALTFEENLFDNKIIKKRLEERSLDILHRNLKKGSLVKITNLLNSRSLVARVINNSNYPLFYNSVISRRIANELEIDPYQPFIELVEINNNSSFIAKKAKTYDEERQVANKAPVSDIKIKDISSKKKKISKTNKKKYFDYKILVADFYFESSALIMLNKIKNETKIKNVKIDEMSDTNFRVFLGPFKDINTLKNSFNAVSVLEFDNLQIIRN